VIEAINIALVLIVLALSAALACAVYQRGVQRGWRDCMRMVSEAAEAQAEREVQEQRAVLRRMQEVDAREAAIERQAAEVARWN
jgi:hypothetical protein